MIQIKEMEKYGVPKFVNGGVYFHTDYDDKHKWGGFEEVNGKLKVYSNTKQWLKLHLIFGIDHFITADGFYSPCCFIADHRFYYKTIFGKQKKFYNIQEYTLSQMLAESTVIDFYQNLDQQPGCQFNCPG
jgi:hypothetical protein